MKNTINYFSRNILFAANILILWTWSACFEWTEDKKSRNVRIQGLRDKQAKCNLSIGEAILSFKTGFFTCHFEDNRKLASKEIKQDCFINIDGAIFISLRPSKGFWRQATLLKNVATIHFYFWQSNMFSFCFFDVVARQRDSFVTMPINNYKVYKPFNCCHAVCLLFLHCAFVLQWHPTITKCHDTEKMFVIAQPHYNKLSGSQQKIFVIVG